MDTLTYTTGFDTATWQHRWTCTHPGCTEGGAAPTRRAAEALAAAHADVHGVRRGSW